MLHLVQSHVISKVPRASRHFQAGLIKHIEDRFDALIQLPSDTQKSFEKILYLAKTLLLDIRHILLFHNLDHDLKNQLISKTEGIIHYTHSFMQGVDLLSLRGSSVYKKKACGF